MPLYEYACLSCGTVCEVLQKAGDPPLLTCGACGGPLKKRICAPAIQFKGKGWYITDYAHKHSPPAETKPNGDKADAGTEKKAEATKDAAKTDAPASPSPK